MAKIWRGIVLLAVLTTSVAGPLVAEGLARPVSAAEATRWRAVAALEVNGHRACSAVLISDHEAITAAHCVYNLATGQKTDPAAFQLVFGQSGAAHAALRGVTAAVFLPGYAAPGAQKGFANVAMDLALLDLDPPVSPEVVLPLTVAEWPNPMGAFVDIVGYERDGAAAATIREGCTAIDSQNGVVAVTCAVISGLSGAPVLLSGAPDQPPQLVATVSSRSNGAGQALAFVVTLAPHLAELRALIGQ